MRPPELRKSNRANEFQQATAQERARSLDPMRAPLRQVHPKGDKGNKAFLRSANISTP
jgi:hypothetical protein